MRKLIKFDKWLMTQMQRAYLWFFDWTGVYVGTITFSLTTLFLLVATGGRLSWFDLVCVVPCSIASMLMYRAQNNGELTRFNHCARQWQNSALRWACNGGFVGFFVLDTAIRTSALAAISDVIFFVWSYVSTVQIRDREPREFWKLSPQRAGS